MSQRTKVLLLAVAPQAIGFLLMAGGLAILWRGAAIFMAGMVIAVGIAIALTRNRSKERNGSAREDGGGFDWEHYLRRERHLIALYGVFLAACVVWLAGLTFGTVLFLCGLLVSVTSSYMYAPRMYAKVSTWEPE